MSVWAEIDRKEDAYKELRDRTLDAIKTLAHARFDEKLTPEQLADFGEDSPVGEVSCGQDEFGWWRSTVKIWGGLDLEGKTVWRELTYQARSAEGLVLAVRLRKEDV